MNFNQLPGLNSSSPWKKFVGAIYYLMLFILLINVVTSLGDYKLVTFQDQLAAFMESLLLFITFSLPALALFLSNKAKSRKVLIYSITAALFLSLCVLAVYINHNFHTEEYWTAIEQENKVNAEIQKATENN